MRLIRKRLRIRAYGKGFQLRPAVDRTAQLQAQDILLFAVLRNDNLRLPHFLQYYRDLGVSHFLLVDNGSTDGSAEYLATQPDVSLWRTMGSYRKARCGVDWLNYIKGRYGHGHWCVTVDADELLVYPFCDTRPLRALTDWLESCSVRAFSAMLLDMYAKAPRDDASYVRGQNPIDTACWFDSGNYTVSHNPLYNNLWIQGGPRARTQFADKPEQAPALNKIPLVKWHRKYAYVSSTHMLLPRGLNLAYGAWDGDKASGVLLHAGLPGATTLADGADQSTAITDGSAGEAQPWCRWSEKYVNWRQLELLGLMSKGNWA
ncbi:glycosyltransferase family 2 protein [Roseobacter cerasinus]|nr:glycosyltransferase family 2 protein [Roseobacter cerasinus]